MSNIEIIREAYESVNSDLMAEMPYNTVDTRHEVIERLLHALDGKLKAIGIRIISDETNNTSDVIDSNQLVAKVEWRENRFTNEIKYIDLVFGRDVEVIWN